MRHLDLSLPVVRCNECERLVNFIDHNEMCSACREEWMDDAWRCWLFSEQMAERDVFAALAHSVGAIKVMFRVGVDPWEVLAA